MHWLIRGFSLLRAPAVRRWVIIPLAINVLFFASMMGLGIWLFARATAAFHQMLPAWLLWLDWLLWPLFLLLLLIVSAWSFATVANIVASPFNSILAEHVQIHLTGERPPAAVGMDIPRALWRQVRYLFYVAPRMLGAGILFIIPGVQVIAPAVWFAFNAWTSSVQYFDYASDNNRQGFGAMLADLRARSGEAWGFGALVAAAMMVPLLNLVVMPAAVAGGTAMWLAQDDRFAGNRSSKEEERVRSDRR